MSLQRDPDAILATWLEEGPNRLPEATRRAIAVNTRTTRQSRRLPDAGRAGSMALIHPFLDA